MNTVNQGAGGLTMSGRFLEVLIYQQEAAMITMIKKICLASITLAIFLAGCTGGGGGQGAGGPGDNPPASAEEAAILAAIVPGINSTLEERKELYKELSPLNFTGWDKINLCEVEGRCTHKAAVQQKILYFLGHPDLNPQFKSEHDGEIDCGNPYFIEISYEISKDPELKKFYDAIFSQVAGGGPLSLVPQLEKGLPFIKEVLAEDIAASPMISINTKSGALNLSVFPDDRFKGYYYEYIDTKETVAVRGDRKFDVYYGTATAQFFPVVKEALNNNRLWDIADQVFTEGITFESPPGQQNPAIFLLPRRNLGGYEPSIFYSDPSFTTGYITILTDTSDPHSVAKYVRGQRTDPWEGGAQVKGTCAHELYHALSYAYFSSRRASHMFQEPHANWFANEAYLGEGLDHIYYKTLLDALGVPFNSPEPVEHQYATALFWNYLGCRVPDRVLPVKMFNRCLRTGTSYDPEICLDQAAASAEGPGLEYAVLKFGLATLNLGDERPEEIVDMKLCDPAYKDFYLAGATLTAPFLLIDGVQTEMADGTMWPRMHVYVGVSRFSVSHYVWVSWTGDTGNNYYKMDASEVCTKPGIACSLMGFVGDDRNASDRSKFKRVFYEKFPASGIVEYIATGVNREPEIMILTIANGNFGTSKGGIVHLETKAFSAPVEFSLEKETNESRPDGGFYRKRIRYEGTFATPDSSFPTVTKEINYPGWAKVEEFDGSLSATNFVPLKDGQVIWDVEDVSYDRSCPGQVVTTRKTSSGNFPISLREDDDYILAIEARRDRDSNFTGDGYLDLLVDYYQGGEGGVMVPFSVTRECRPCNPARCGEVVSESTEVDLIEIPSLSAAANFTDGATHLSLTNSHRTGTTTGSISFPQPIEVPRAWERKIERAYGGPRASVPYQYGGLYGDTGSGFLMYQLIPPIIDFPKQIENAQRVQPNLPPSAFVGHMPPYPLPSR